MILHESRIILILLLLVGVAGCAGEDGAPETDPPKEIEVAGDTARLGGFAIVTANAEGHARVVVQQPEPEHTAWLHEHGFRFRTFILDTAAAEPDTSEPLPDSLGFERDLAPGTLVYTRETGDAETL